MVLLCLQEVQTQICDVVTLAPLSEAQKVDGLDDNVTTKRYIHHYNFPSYSVGETKPQEDQDVERLDTEL